MKGFEMSGVGGIGGAGNGNLWGNYGSTTNPPFGFPTQAPAGSYSAQQRGNPNEKNSDGYFIRDDHGYPDAPHERDAAYAKQPQALHQQYPMAPPPQPQQAAQSAEGFIKPYIGPLPDYRLGKGGPGRKTKDGVISKRGQKLKNKREADKQKELALIQKEQQLRENINKTHFQNEIMRGALENARKK